MRKSNNSGFTLIELVIVIVLVGVIGSMAADAAAVEAMTVQG